MLGLYLDDGAAVLSALLHLGVVSAAVLEDRLVVVDVSDEYHHDSGTRVYSGLSVDTARAIVHRRHVQLVLVPVQRDCLVVQPDHSGDLFYHKLP